MTTSHELSLKMDEILIYITDYLDSHGFPPSIRDIMSALSIKSTSSVHSYLQKMSERGDIEYNSGKKRAIELKSAKIVKQRDITSVPNVGRVPAGAPTLALEDYQDAFCLPANLFSRTDCLFILDVEGSSMIEAGIFDKDRIVVKKQNTAENGQIVVAMLDDERATVKRFYKETDHIRLHPENSHMSDIIAQNVTVLGVVVGLIRTNIK